MHETIRRFRRLQDGETSAPELLRECGEKLTDRTLWVKFHERFHGLIFLYLMRTLRMQRIEDDAGDIVPDLAQEVYVRLVQHDGRILRSFRGDTEFSAMAFLARISSAVARDYQRQTATEKRGFAQVVPIDAARASEKRSSATGLSEFGDSRLNALLQWIDIERIVEGDPDQKNAGRNALIFKLHYVDGFEAGEIARFPGFGLKTSGVDSILTRLRKRIQE